MHNQSIQQSAVNLVVYTCAAAQMTSMCCLVMQHSAARKLRMIWLCLIICQVPTNYKNVGY